MHYFAIADYAPPTYEEATSTNQEQEQNLLQQRTANQNTANNNSLESSTNQNTPNNQSDENRTNENARHSSHLVSSTNQTQDNSSLNSAPPMRNSLQVNTSALGNADMGTSILKQAGVLNQNDNVVTRRPQSYSRYNSRESNSVTPDRTSTRPHSNNSSVHNQPPNLTFSSSASNSSANSGALGLTTASSFTDVTQDSNLYNPVYTAFHSSCINNNQRPDDRNTERVPPLERSNTINDSDQDDNVYDTPKEYKSQENLIIPTRGSSGGTNSKISHSNPAFVKGSTGSLNVDGNVKVVQPLHSESEGGNKPIQPNEHKHLYVNMTFDQTESVQKDSEI